MENTKHAEAVDLNKLSNEELQSLMWDLVKQAEDHIFAIKYELMRVQDRGFICTAAVSANAYEGRFCLALLDKALNFIDQRQDKESDKDKANA